MAKVERVLVADGDWFIVECAVRKDLSSPVLAFLEELEKGQVAGADEQGMPADEQVSAEAWFIAACAAIAETGRPPHGKAAYNQLNDGIWELKRSAARVTFFDTDGEGGFDPVVDRTSYGPYEQRPWPEGFDEVLRLATGFVKTGRRTPEREIGFARVVRREDLDHDRR